MAGVDVTAARFHRGRLVLVTPLLALGLLGLASGPVRGDDGAGPARGDEGSLMAPPLPRGTSRAVANLRPFFNMLGPGWGAINDFAVEHYFVRAPVKVLAVVSPLALAVEPDGAGMITHARLGGAFATDFLELGLSAGGRYQRFGPGGYSLSIGLRLGALDGLNARVDLTYAIVRNYYRGQVEYNVSNLLTTFEVPVHPRVALFLEAGFSFDAWFFATLGLKHHLGPRGARGTWTVRGGLGIAWVLDRFPCQYSDPTPCEDVAWATGPTVTMGLARRF